MKEVVPLNHCPEELFHRIRPIWALSHEDLYNYNTLSLAAAIAEANDGHNPQLDSHIDMGIISCVNYLAPTTEKYESIFPQIAAQTIAMARYQPREVFGIEFSHRYVTFWRTLIPESYLELVKGSGDLPPDMVLKMKRSTVLDLELPDGRREFSRAFLALLMYWNKQVEPSE
ncbi:hypothetical protein IWQ61_010381 [Dispira simplex]|nr:hypothetical protein IWQ61_010381 [Dispira simplex]